MRAFCWISFEQNSSKTLLCQQLSGLIVLCFPRKMCTQQPELHPNRFQILFTFLKYILPLCDLKLAEKETFCKKNYELRIHEGKVQSHAGAGV